MASVGGGGVLKKFPALKGLIGFLKRVFFGGGGREVWEEMLLLFVVCEP